MRVEGRRCTFASLWTWLTLANQASGGPCKRVASLVQPAQRPAQPQARNAAMHMRNPYREGAVAFSKIFLETHES